MESVNIDKINNNILKLKKNQTKYFNKLNDKIDLSQNQIIGNYLYKNLKIFDNNISKSDYFDNQWDIDGLFDDIKISIEDNITNENNINKITVYGESYGWYFDYDNNCGYWDNVDILEYSDEFYKVYWTNYQQVDYLNKDYIVFGNNLKWVWENYEWYPILIIDNKGKKVDIKYIEDDSIQKNYDPEQIYDRVYY